MFDTDEEEPGADRNEVLKKHAENTTDWLCENRQTFREIGTKRKLKLHIRK